MLKTFAGAAGFTSVNVFDVFSGMKTGASLNTERDIQKYDCPEPQLSENVEKYMGMYQMAYGFMKP